MSAPKLCQAEVQSRDQSIPLAMSAADLRGATSRGVEAGQIKRHIYKSTVGEPYYEISVFNARDLGNQSCL